MGVLKFPDNTVFGLDIGTRSVVGTVGYRKPTGEFVILAQKSECHETRAMMDGQIHDVEKVTETVSKVKQELEDELDAVLTEVCIAAAGRVLKTVTVTADYELGESSIITEDMVYGLEMKGLELAQAQIKAEEKESGVFYCVGYSVVRYFLGGVQITRLEGHKASKISAEVIATFLPADVIDGLYLVCEKVGLKVLNLTLEPVAAINLAIPEKFRQLNLALVDIGAGTSDICITKGGTIIGYGMLPCAGDFFTESIMNELLIDFDTAEKIKLAASTKRKKVAFTDVIGKRHSVEVDSIKEILVKPFETLSTRISDKIKELNGGDRVGAIFIVGGGGKNPKFQEILSNTIELPSQRVVLRGQEVFTGIISPDHKPIKDPMLVTPIGICMNYYAKNNNFIVIKMNGQEIKLFDNGNVNVMDAIIGGGMSEKDVFPKRGKDLVFKVNGEERTLKGKKGDYSVVTVNDKEGAVTTALKNDDVVMVKPSTKGEDAVCTVGDLREAKEEIFFIVNGKKAGFAKVVLKSGEAVDPSYKIKDGDDITVCDFYTLKMLLEALNALEGMKVTINNKQIDLNDYDPDEKIIENYIVDVVPDKKEEVTEPVEEKTETAVESEAEDENTEEEEVEETDNKSGHDRTVTVTVNGTPVELKGKVMYTFVDVLDFYPFNTTSLQGSQIVSKKNGRSADFFTPVNEGDKLELFWV